MADSMMEWSVRDAKEHLGPGSVVMDGWELKEQLGRGGFGNVWLAEKNLFGIRDQSAIKIIRIPRDPDDVDVMLAEGFSTSSIQAELRRSVENAVREVRAMIYLRNHPAIVLCEGFDVIQYEEDGTWEIDIRMQLLMSLTDWAAGRDIGSEDVIRLGVSLSDLLSVCEKKDLLHRDIKPANIFVDPLNNFRLGDFGLARVISDSGSTHSRGAGTEAFMAPEVFSSGKYDHRADIYSLGLVMYWLLNRLSLPFADEKISRSQAISMRLSGEAVPELPGIDPELDRIIRKACDPDPEKRWKTAQEFHDILVCPRPATVLQPVSVLQPVPVPQQVPVPQPQPEAAKPEYQPDAGKPIIGLYDKNRVFTSGDYRGYLLNNGTVSLDFYTGNETNLVIPETLDGKKISSIGGYHGTFGYNQHEGFDITSITIPDSVTVIGSGNPFNWKALQAIHVSGNHPDLEIVDGVLFRKSDRRVVCCPHALPLETFSIPNGTKEIGPWAFNECRLLKSVIIPDSVVKIGDYAFMSCTSLASADIPRYVRNLGIFTFAGCNLLSSVSLNNYVESIGDYAFSGCALKDIRIPNSVKALGKYAFFKCISLEYVFIPAGMNSIGSNAFTGCSKLTVRASRGSYAAQYCVKNAVRYEYWN